MRVKGLTGTNSHENAWQSWYIFIIFIPCFICLVFLDVFGVLRVKPMLNAQCHSTLLGEASNDNAFRMLAPASSGLHWWREQSQAVTDVTAPNRNPWFDSCKKKGLSDPFDPFWDTSIFLIVVYFKSFCFSSYRSMLCGKLHQPARYRHRIAEMTESKGAHFLDYDCDKGLWQFRVFDAIKELRDGHVTHVLFVASISFQHLSNSLFL